MVTIRKARKADIAELAKIYKRAYDRPKFGEKWDIKETKALLNFYLQQKTFLGLTALVDGKIVGAFFSCAKPTCVKHKQIVKKPIIINNFFIRSYPPFIISLGQEPGPVPVDWSS